MNYVMNLISAHSDYIFFLIFMIVNILDWITGWIKSRLNKKENSSIGLQGIIKKIGNCFIVFCGFILSYAFVRLGTIININMQIFSFIGWFVLISLIINEIRSILENLVECNIYVPKFFIKGLEILDKKIGDAFENEKTN